MDIKIHIRHAFSGSPRNRRHPPPLPVDEASPKVEVSRLTIDPPPIALRAAGWKIYRPRSALPKMLPYVRFNLLYFDRGLCFEGEYD